MKKILYKKILEEKYKIKSASILSQTGGWASLAYKVEALDGMSYFLKVYEKGRASTTKWTALIDAYAPVLQWLNTTSLDGKTVKLIRTVNDENKCEDYENIYMLFDYVDGYTIGEKDLTDEQVIELAEIIATLHCLGSRCPLSTTLLNENFELPFGKQLLHFINNDLKLADDDLRKVINPYIRLIEDLMEATMIMASQLITSGLVFTLCHTDAHSWNLIQTKTNLVLLDWEGLRFAPPEADLFMFTDKPWFEKFLSVYKSVHKEYHINHEALSFYMSRRKIEDIWEFVEQLYYDKMEESLRTDTLLSLSKELTSLDLDREKGFV